MKRVLIIDDDKNFTDTLKDSLKERTKDRVEINVVSNPKDAIVFLSQHSVDIIILDVHLEGMHGFEFLEMLKKNPSYSSIPVIMISARYIEPIDRIKALEMGAAEYFTKPFDIELVCREIERYVKN